MQYSLWSGRFLRVWRSYENQLKKRPVPVQMTTSAVLWAVGDVLAQRVAEQRPKVDKQRVLQTAGFGAGFMGPVGHYWYLIL
jgi:protein Mpv17